MSKTFTFVFMICSFCVSVPAQGTQTPQTLAPGQPVEREIDRGQTHAYRISLAAGQFMRVVVEQRGMDVKVALAAPGGEQLTEFDFTRIGGMESLSAEAAASGDYRLTVRATAVENDTGTYQVRLEVKAAATAQDRERISAERSLGDLKKGFEQGAKVETTVDKGRQVLTLWRELGDPYWEAVTLRLIGRAYGSVGQNEQALEAYDRSLVIRRELKDRVMEAESLNNVGYAYLRLGRNEKAIESYEQALAIFREAKNRVREDDTLLNLGNANDDLLRYEKAIEYYEQALTVAREVKFRKNEAAALYSLGNDSEILGRPEKAIEYYEQALTIYREVKNREFEGITLRGIGVVYSFGLSRHEKAIEYYEQALAIAREIKSRVGEGDMLSTLGVAYANLNRYEKAIEYYEQSLAIFREIKSRQGEAIELNNLGNAYYSLSRYDKAIEYFEQSLAICREVKDRKDEGIALGNLGNCYLLLSRYDKAIEYFEQSLAILANRAQEAITFQGLGGAYRGLKRYDKAIEYHEQALAISREVKNRAKEGSALIDLGSDYYSLGRYDKAVEYCKQALAIHREVKDRLHEADTLYTLALAERAQGDLPAARTYIEESLKVAESMRSDLLSPESRSTFLTTVQSSYHLYTDVLMRQHRADPTRGFDALAVETSERQRARSMLDLLAEAHADVRQGVDAALIERERTLAKQLNHKAQQLGQATKPEQAAALKQEVSQLETDLERAQVAIRKASPHYAALTQPQPLKLKEIQAQLDADTLLLEYSLGDERSYLWAISKDSLASYELPKGEVIEKGAREVYQLLTARSMRERGETTQQRQQRITQAEAQLPAAAQSLSQTILAPVTAQLGNKRLVIVAAGALQYIPFAMLPEPSVVSSQLSVAKNNGHPLIVKHEIISLPSASALAIQRSELAGRQPAPKMLAVIADPVFDRFDSRFTTLATDTGDKAQTQTIGADDARSIEHLAENSADKSGVTTLRLAIPRLPFTRQEANQLMALAPKGSSFKAIDFQASRATVLDPALSQYRYVHIATHGWLDAERPGLSALVFSMVDAEGKPQNGFLRANDIYNLKLPAELVVLSACQTGLGKEIKGEGLVGLTRGFMYAGAARVVVSLWNVNDQATADLMTKFYEKMLKQGQPPAAALRAAQVEMWKQKQWQSPYYWAAFTMQGEWR
jgi:CHAT domain-containing protein/tetratricopeptide (TPR) repeat protein